MQSPEKLKRRASWSSTTPTASSGTTSIPLQVGFKKYGQSGIEVSDWLPHIGECVDDIAVVRSMYTTDDNHGAQTQFHSGRHMLDGEFPTLGAWVHTAWHAQRQPAAVHLHGHRGTGTCKDGHYLGPAHDAVPLRVDPTNPLDYGKPEVPARGRGAGGSGSTWSTG